MFPQPEIRILPPLKLAGMHLRMSMAGNRTAELWRTFMPRRREIANAVGNKLYSLEIYDGAFIPSRFTEHTPFTKWSAVEVSGHDHLPQGMELLQLEGGMYAVFNYKGPAGDPAIYRYIFSEWLPSSGFGLDDRPHMAIMGEKYKGFDPDSEEEIWIPVKNATRDMPVH